MMYRVRNAVKRTTSPYPQEVLLSDGRVVPIADLKTGDVIALRAGDVIMADGNVVKGDGVVDESSLTGESMPIPKKRGDAVTSGTVVQNGYMEVEATAAGMEATLHKLNQAIEDVQAERGECAKVVYELYDE